MRVAVPARLSDLLPLRGDGNVTHADPHCDESFLHFPTYFPFAGMETPMTTRVVIRDLLFPTYFPFAGMETLWGGYNVGNRPALSDLLPLRGDGNAWSSSNPRARSSRRAFRPTSPSRGWKPLRRDRKSLVLRHLSDLLPLRGDGNYTLSYCSGLEDDFPTYFPFAGMETSAD